jgi:hypothetical protein
MDKKRFNEPPKGMPIWATARLDLTGPHGLADLGKYILQPQDAYDFVCSNNQQRLMMAYHELMRSLIERGVFFNVFKCS